jgi:hypothetical protein
MGTERRGQVSLGGYLILFLDGLRLLDAHSVSILPIGMDALGGREFTKGSKDVQKSVSPE